MDGAPQRYETEVVAHDEHVPAIDVADGDLQHP